MFHVINKMNPAVISKHNTRAAAEKAAARYQKAVRGNGNGNGNGYLNLEIFEGKPAEVAGRLDEILRGF